MGLQQSKLLSFVDRLGSAGDLELFEDATQMRLHGFLRDEEGVANGPIRESTGDQTHHIALTDTQYRGTVDRRIARRRDDLTG